MAPLYDRVTADNAFAPQQTSPVVIETHTLQKTYFVLRA
jgi:hypothetical protein